MCPTCTGLSSIPAPTIVPALRKAHPVVPVSWPTSLTHRTSLCPANPWEPQSSHSEPFWPCSRCRGRGTFPPAWNVTSTPLGISGFCMDSGTWGPGQTPGLCMDSGTWGAGQTARLCMDSVTGVLARPQSLGLLGICLHSIIMVTASICSCVEFVRKPGAGPLAHTRSL